MDKEMRLQIDGMGIVLYSAKTMDSVEPGYDFLEQEFTEPQQVAEHIMKGDITGFCTGTGGDFDLKFIMRGPTAEEENSFPLAIRLGLEVRGGSIQFCDLFWLSSWNSSNFPEEQVLPMEDGFYELTVCTRCPDSGYWGDEQTICIYFRKTESMPKLKWAGVPMLFTDDE